MIPLAEEQVEIGKRRVDDATRIRRYVVETPVERQVTLRDETVEIERRRPVEGTSPDAGAFEERTVRCIPAASGGSHQDRQYRRRGCRP